MESQQPTDRYRSEAFDLLERNIAAAVEKDRSSVTGDVGRLHNELAAGLTVPTSRMTKLLNQAVSEVMSHQSFLQRSDDDQISAPAATFEQNKALVESYLASSSGAIDQANVLKKGALEFVERDYKAQVESTRRDDRLALSLTAPTSFGYHWGRIGLGFDGALGFSNNLIKQAVTSAEESLMNTGKWVGTVAEYTLTLSASGEVFLPREIDTVLFTSFDGDPRPVHDRYAGYMRGGSGVKSLDNTGRSGFSDLGTAVDPVDGKTKRKYFVSVPTEGEVTQVRYLAKRRFVPHVLDTEKMYLDNFGAVEQAALAILTQGKMGVFEAAKKLLADQVAQDFFKSQIWSPRKINSLR